MKPSFNSTAGTLCLSFAGGFCDAVTFVVVTEMFSAHVTGNFIEFARDLVLGTDSDGWSKLMVFPVFVFAVMTGGIMLRGSSAPQRVLIFEGLLLTVSAAAGLAAVHIHGDLHLVNYWIALAIVFAMGLQNAYSKAFGNDLHGSTTVMTGNVTQLSLDLADFIFKKKGDKGIRQRLFQGSLAVCGFLAGALIGAVGARYFSTVSVLLPAMVVIAFATWASPSNNVAVITAPM